MRSRIDLSGLLLVLLLAFASQAAAFAHASSRPPDAALASFIALGGNPQDICDRPDGSSNPHDHLQCGTCLLVGQPALLNPNPKPDPQLSLRSSANLQMPDTVRLPARRALGWPARGPPQA
jgi:hypothetical protein